MRSCYFCRRVEIFLFTSGTPDQSWQIQWLPANESDPDRVRVILNSIELGELKTNGQAPTGPAAAAGRSFVKDEPTAREIVDRVMARDTSLQWHVFRQWAFQR